MRSWKVQPASHLVTAMQMTRGFRRRDATARELWGKNRDAAEEAFNKKLVNVITILPLRVLYNHAAKLSLNYVSCVARVSGICLDGASEHLERYRPEPDRAQVYKCGKSWLIVELRWLLVITMRIKRCNAVQACATIWLRMFEWFYSKSI